jgi:uncharacterized protein YifN (PemK superfamily)
VTNYPEDGRSGTQKAHMKYHKQEEARPSLNVQKERQIIMVRTGQMNHSATLLIPCTTRLHMDSLLYT